MICTYCERYCDIPEAASGYCRMYRNESGTVVENYPDGYLNTYAVSSESIPMLHFYPNHVFMLVSTIGCNFSCDGCISAFQTTRNGTLEQVLTTRRPEEILALARESGCRGVVFCLNEPTVSLPTFLRLALAAKSEGFLVGCSSNGYMTDESLDQMLPVLDFVNIGLKGSTDERYRECGAESVEPVFRNLQRLHDAGVFIEVSTMYLLGREEEILGVARRVREISPAIPFQVMRFIATTDDLLHLQPGREQAEAICTILRSIVEHVYLFNTPATTELDSRCPVCNKVIIHRVFFGPMAARVLSCADDGRCSCGYVYPKIGDILPVPKEGLRVLGGYRSVMGAKYIISHLNLLGIDDEAETDRICNEVISNGYLQQLQEQTDSVENFIAMTRYLSSLCGREQAGERMIAYVTQVISALRGRIADADTPRVYAVFCHPLSPVYARKFTNTLVEMAGGKSLNIQENFEESRHAEYSVDELNRINPEVILVAGPVAPDREHFMATCRDLGITCNALDSSRVYIQESGLAGGNLGWLISLMDVANCVHPEVFAYDLVEERGKLDRFQERLTGRNS